MMVHGQWQEFVSRRDVFSRISRVKGKFYLLQVLQNLLDVLQCFQDTTPRYKVRWRLFEDSETWNVPEVDGKIGVPGNSDDVRADGTHESEIRVIFWMVGYSDKKLNSCSLSLRTCKINWFMARTRCLYGSSLSAFSFHEPSLRSVLWTRKHETG